MIVYLYIHDVGPGPPSHEPLCQPLTRLFKAKYGKKNSDIFYLLLSLDDRLELSTNLGEVLLHLSKDGKLIQLIPSVPLAHGVHDGLHDGHVGSHLILLFPQELPSWHLQCQGYRFLPSHLDGQCEEGGHDGHLGWHAKAGCS